MCTVWHKEKKNEKNKALKKERKERNRSMCQKE